MIVSGSFLRTCVSALRARKVLDTHMGFKVPFQGTSIGKLFTSKLARFLYQLLFLLCDGALVDLAPCTLLAHPAAQNIVQRPTTIITFRYAHSKMLENYPNNRKSQYQITIFGPHSYFKKSISEKKHYIEYGRCLVTAKAAKSFANF